jgi:tRNA/rRNA methyltransferase
VALPDLVPIIDREIARGGRIALVFGSEKRGLTRDDLALCHQLVEIPTHPGQPSMNLGQAVAVCLYELTARHNCNPAACHSTEPDGAASHDPPATAGDLELLANVVGKTLAAANYAPQIMRNTNRHDLDPLLRRLSLTRSDARRVLGVFRRILWQLEHHSGTDPIRSERITRQ